MRELTDTCAKCLGCNRLDDPNFKGLDKCKYQTLEQIDMSGYERCKKIIEQIKMEGLYDTI